MYGPQRWKLLSGSGDVQGQQMAQRIHRRMHLGSLPPLGSVVSSGCPTPASIAACGCPESSPWAWACARQVRAAASAGLPPSSRNNRAQVEKLAGEVQQITEQSAELAYVDQGYTGEAAAQAAAKHGI